MSEKVRNRGRMAIYSMAGFYLLYMAYKLSSGLPDSSGNTKILMIVFMVFFALVGGGMLIGGIIGGYKLSMPQKADSFQEMLEPSEENEEEE